MELTQETDGINTGDWWNEHRRLVELTQETGGIDTGDWWN